MAILSNYFVTVIVVITNDCGSVYGAILSFKIGFEKDFKKLSETDFNELLTAKAQEILKKVNVKRVRQIVSITPMDFTMDFVLKSFEPKVTYIELTGDNFQKINLLKQEYE